ncbi:MAG: transposase [Actinobacteria bacterium]|nr:transposase [Actinomycetota bacterium]
MSSARGWPQPRTTKPELGAELIQRAVAWEISSAPVLGDQAYGDDSKLREHLDAAGLEYVLAVRPAASVFAPETVFDVPARNGTRGRSRKRLRPDRKPESIAALIARLGIAAAQTVTFRDGPNGTPVTSRFIFTRVRTLKKWATAPPSSLARSG